MRALRSSEYGTAIAGGRGNQFGLGAAITVFIFFIVLGYFVVPMIVGNSG